jgi:branched-chain amino acid aminotransferase
MGERESLLCAVDGSIGPVSEARIAVADDGFLRGDGAFEVLRLYGGRPFALVDHLDRLDRTAEGIFLEWDRAAFEREIESLLQANDAPGDCLRLVVTRGGRRIAIVEPRPTFQHDMTLQSVTYQPTIVLTGLKTLSYSANMTATRIAQSRGAKEALLVLPGGKVLEAPTSTLFWAARDGVVRTPRLEAGILASITRDRIMQIVPVEEGDYELSDVLEASEVFLASSVREVQGVEDVDGVAFGSPGPATERIAGLLAERIEAELSSAVK